MLKQIFRNNQLENSISQKFQALIIEMIPLRLVTKAGMRKRFRKQ